MGTKQEVAKILIENNLLDYPVNKNDEEDIEFIEYEIKVEDNQVCIMDILSMTKTNLLKLEKLLGAKDFYIGMNGHMEYIYVVYKL